MSESSLWTAAGYRLADEFGLPVQLVRPLGRPREDRITWAAKNDELGDVIIKVRTEADRASEKVRWCADKLPLLAARGYPVPEIVWHGPLDVAWYLVVERRLPGRPLHTLDEATLGSLLALVELQADAAIEPGPRDMAGYQAAVLFNGWDYVWRDAEAASSALCARLRHWLQPAWGHRLVPRDFAHGDLNLTNVLRDGTSITGVVDWDEFGLNSRAADLTTILFDMQRLRLGGDAHPPARASAQLLGRIGEVACEPGLRCAITYAAIARLAVAHRRPESDALANWIAVTSSVLDLVGAT